MTNDIVEIRWKDKRTKVEKTELPFQEIDVLKEPKIEQKPDQKNYNSWRNMLIWGENKIAMSSLSSKLAGKINLIYIDPPFTKNEDFSVPMKLEEYEWVKKPTVIEELAYRSIWGGNMAGYLQFIYDRLSLMRDLLSDNGSIYVHLDHRVVHHVKVIMDEIFPERFVNEIVWVYTGRESQTAKKFVKKHDIILFYSKSGDYIFNQQYEPYDEKYIELYFTQKDDDGRLFQWQPDGKGGHYKQYLDKSKGIPLRDWWKIKPVHGMDFMKKSKSEYVRFRNQKPEELLERIIKTSSNEGDIIADFFCGSGTALAVAEKLGRKWVGCDLSKFAIHTTKKRLLDIPTCKPFLILNVGNYQKQKFVENIKNSKIESYINFILELYRAEPVSGYRLLNGRKDWCFVHVGSVDSPITEKEVVDALEECKSANGKGLDFLGWDFEMGLDEIVEKLEKQFGVKIKLKQIPREVIESKETSKGIKFFDMNSFEVVATVSGKTVTLKLKDFVLANLEFVPEDVKEKIKNGMDYVDYWSVDFDFKNDVPIASWQSFRTNKNPNLNNSCKHDYKQRGKYDILVRVADIFGNDATKLIKVEIK